MLNSFAKHYGAISNTVKYCNKRIVPTKMLTMPDQDCDLVGHWQILVDHCQMTDSYLQSWSRDFSTWDCLLVVSKCDGEKWGGRKFDTY